MMIKQSIRILRSVFLLLFCTYLLSCALTPEDIPRQNFVETKELKIVSLLDEASAFNRIGRYLDAELKIWQALYLAPKNDNRAIRLLLAEVLGKQNLHQQAEAFYQSVLEETPNARSALIVWARYLNERGEYERSKAVYEKILAITLERMEPFVPKKKAPINPFDRIIPTKIDTLSTPLQLSQLHRNLAVINYEQWDVEGVLCESHKALSQLPSPLESARHARILNSLGFTEKVAEMLFPKTKSLNTLPELLLEMAMAQLENKKEEQSIRICKAVLSKRDVAPEIFTPCQWIAAYRHIFVPEEKEEEEEDLKEAQEKIDGKGKKNTPALEFLAKKPKTEEELERDEERKREEILGLPDIEVETNTSRIYWPNRFLLVVDEVQAYKQSLEEE